MKFRSLAVLSLVLAVALVALTFLFSSESKENEDVRVKILKAFEFMENNDGVSAKKTLSDVIPGLTGEQIFPYFAALMGMVNYGFLTEAEELFQESKAFINVEFDVRHEGDIVGKSKISCIILPSAYGMKLNGTKDLETKLNFLKSIMQKYSLVYNKRYCSQSALGPGESDKQIEASFYGLFPHDI